MKPLLLSLFFLLLIGFVNAQSTDSIPGPVIKKNIIKVNLGAIVVKNYSFQYERAVRKKMSVALGIRFQPYGSIPFKSTLEREIDDPDVKISDI